MTIQGQMFMRPAFAAAKSKVHSRQIPLEEAELAPKKLNLLPTLSPQGWQVRHKVKPVRFGVREETKKQVRLFQPLVSVANIPAEGLLTSDKSLESFTTDPVMQPLQHTKLFTHQGYDHSGQITYDHYFLLDPGVSRKLLLNEQNATPEHLTKLWMDYFKPWELFNPPLYNPDANEKTEWIDWLPKPYSEIEMAALRHAPKNGLAAEPITSVPSHGGDRGGCFPSCIPAIGQVKWLPYWALAGG
jgi:hypothetical protein